MYVCVCARVCIRAAAGPVLTRTSKERRKRKGKKRAPQADPRFDRPLPSSCVRVCEGGGIPMYISANVHQCVYDDGYYYSYQNMSDSSIDAHIARYQLIINILYNKKQLTIAIITFIKYYQECEQFEIHAHIAR